ncbi:23S rRNA (uracil(1939)-C(5))-methyltransferase RlmD [Candidatus Cloacimonadaceae bacterium]
MKQILKLKIEKLALGGFGLGFSEGRAIFVPYTAPGDEVDVLITHQRKDHAFGKANHFHQHGAAYREPECEAFGAEVPCGGCDWLMLDYPAQLKAKQALVEEMFSPQVDSRLINPTLASPKPRHYRNKVFMPVGKLSGTGKTGYGIFSRYTHTIVPHQACLNHPPVFDQLAKSILEACEKAGVAAYNEAQHRGNLRHLGFRSSSDGKQVLVILVTLSAKLPFSNLLVKKITAEFPQVCGIVQNINRQRGNVILGEETKLLYGSDSLSDTLSDLRFELNYRSFWQINTGTMENILCSLRAALKPQSVVLDAFCGIGAIGLSMASQVKRLALLEDNPQAIADARLNAANNGIDNLSFYTGRFEALLPQVIAELNPDTIIMDPPRSGVDAQSLQLIAEKKIKQIIYLSCSPITLLRDLKLLKAGGYKITSLQSFDMFPNTWHIECLAILSLS